jgi:hypothetical protein
MLSHNVVKDLLPQYIDGLCSDETNTEMSEHLENCYECESVYKAMTEDIPTEETEVKDIDYLKKIKSKNLKRIIVAACGVAALAFAFVFIFVIGVPARSDDISLAWAQITTQKSGDVSEGDARLSQYKTADHTLMLTMVGEGNFSVREEVTDTPNFSVMTPSGAALVDRIVTLHVNVVPEFLGNGKSYTYSLDNPEIHDYSKVKTLRVVVKTADKEYIASRVAEFAVTYDGDTPTIHVGDNTPINLPESIRYSMFEIDTKDNE